MINIKLYRKPKNGDSSSNSGGSSTTIVNGSSAADNWFVFDSDNNAVCCKYDFYSVGAVTANGSSSLTDSLGLTTSQMAALQQLLSDPSTADKLMALAGVTTVANNEVSIDATVVHN